MDPQRDALYADPAAHKALLDARPWKTDPSYFKHVRISALALLKMVIHARSGGSIEIMGLMQGYVTDETFVVTDAFRLPVEGTETRVNAQEQAYEYMVQYLQSSRDSGRGENAVGWYHSHPGYGCWLSGIDVSTEEIQQTFTDPFCAVVIDPDRTISAGKVEIGAFRTYPKDYKPPGGSADDGYQSIPLNKVEDFGTHASRYYSLEVSHFKSSLDSELLSQLWNKYWVATISQSPLFSNREYSTKQIQDLGAKALGTANALDMSARASAMGGPGVALGGIGSRKSDTQALDERLNQVVKDGNKIASEERSGLSAEETKRKLFRDVGAEA